MGAPVNRFPPGQQVHENGVEAFGRMLADQPVDMPAAVGMLARVVAEKGAAHQLAREFGEAGPAQHLNPFVRRARQGPGILRTRADARQDQGGDPFGMAGRQVERDAGPHREADEGRLLDPQPVEQGDQIVGEDILGIGLGIARRFGQAVAGQIGNDDPIAIGEALALAPPHAPAASQAVHQDHRRTRAALVVVQADPVRLDLRHEPPQAPVPAGVRRPSATSSSPPTEIVARRNIIQRCRLDRLVPPDSIFSPMVRRRMPSPKPQ
jgi:hypothetical protein